MTKYDITGPATPHSADVLTKEAASLLADVHHEFNERRRQLLSLREERQAEFDHGVRPDFLPETRSVREGEWMVDPVPSALADRRVEITGPVDAKMVINALNSGAKMFMADFEDATSPTWENLVEGQYNLLEAQLGTLQLETPRKSYRLGEETATLLVRPRGWHLPEKHFLVDGRPVSGALFDFTLYMCHGGRSSLEMGSGPFFYLPKLESHLEARLWNDVICYVSDRLGIPLGTVKATVLIETITAAFEMEEILYELRNHSSGLNAGRWDYIFSFIKKFRNHAQYVLPDRSQVGMTAPFMHAYTELGVATCHRRGAHAMGGMAAFIPNRRDPEVTERALAAVAADKRREAEAGCDGTWVAHPDLIPVAMSEFDRILGGRPNQIGRQRDDVAVTAEDLLNPEIEGGAITEGGVRTNVSVGIRYMASWLSGTGAAAIDNLMEDAATAEISRSQIWQWVRHGARLDNGMPVTAPMVEKIAAEELSRIREAVGEDMYRTGRFQRACEIFSEVALEDEFVEFLTLPAYRDL
ncbi:MAG: malate synthase A [bacterium]|nr:malate synthase A [Acidimicrobiia bacterium]MCY4650421.1 malate synthase A [bacterium]